MNTTHSRRIIVIVAAVAVLFAIAWGAAGPVRASLGNTGVPGALL